MEESPYPPLQGGMKPFLPASFAGWRQIHDIFYRVQGSRLEAIFKILSPKFTEALFLWMFTAF